MMNKLSILPLFLMTLFQNFSLLGQESKNIDKLSSIYNYFTEKNFVFSKSFSRKMGKLDLMKKDEFMSAQFERVIISLSEPPKNLSNSPIRSAFIMKKQKEGEYKLAYVVFDKHNGKFLGGRSINYDYNLTMRDNFFNIDLSLYSLHTQLKSINIDFYDLNTHEVNDVEVRRIENESVRAIVIGSVASVFYLKYLFDNKASCGSSLKYVAESFLGIIPLGGAYYAVNRNSKKVQEIKSKRKSYRSKLLNYVSEMTLEKLIQNQFKSSVEAFYLYTGVIPSLEVNKQMKMSLVYSLKSKEDFYH